MKIKARDSQPVNMAGMGPSAWDRDEHKVSMHPPLPGHIEYVAEQIARHEDANAHHIVHRRHPAEDCDEIIVPYSIGREDFQRTSHSFLHHMLKKYWKRETRNTKPHVISTPGICASPSRVIHEM